MRVDPRQSQLDRIALGEAGPAEAFPLLRELLTEDAQRFARRVYLALQDVVLRIVADRAPSTEAGLWLDVCGRASVLMLQGGAEAASHQVAALGDLVERTARFFEAQPMDEVLGRRHVPEILRLLAGNAGRMHRAALLDTTGLGQSNLSRMLAMLEKHGLVRRDRSGREAELSLTATGMAAAARSSADAAPVRPDALWQATGVGVCVSTGDGRVLSANAGFEDAVGTSAEMAVASVSHGSGVDDVGTAHDRWVRRVAIGETEGGTVSVWVDVSDLHRALVEARMRVLASEAKAAGLRESLAKADAATALAEGRLRRQQLSVEAVRERAVGRLGNMARIVEASLVGGRSAAAAAGERPYLQIVAIKDALDNLLDARAPSNEFLRAGRQNGQAIFEGVVRSAYALTNSRVDVHYPDWLRTERADYRALVEPLGQFLLNAAGDIAMGISRDERNVYVHCTGRSSQAGGAPRGGLFSPFAAAELDAFAATWAGQGLGVEITEPSDRQHMGFRLSVPRGVGGIRDAVG